MEREQPIFGKTLTWKGQELLPLVEAGVCEGLACDGTFQPAARLNLFGRAVSRNRAPSLPFLAGMAASGLRTAAFLEDGKAAHLSAVHLADIARQNLPLTLHMALSADEQAGVAAPHWHRAVQQALMAGWFQLAPANLQEAADFALIAHRIAEISLIPGFCVLDASLLKQSREVILPDAATVRNFLGSPDRHITCPTPAQRLLFGNERRLIPQWLNHDLPAITGMSKGPYGLALEETARARFLFHHLPSIVRQAMENYYQLTGRKYSPVVEYEAQRADYLLIVPASSFDTAAEVVAMARKQNRVKAGCLQLAVIQPFPEEELASLLSGKKGVTILEAVENAEAGSGTLFRKFQAAVRHLGKRAPLLYSGLYSGRPSAAALSAALENMYRKSEKREQFFLGVDFSRPAKVSPQQEILQQAIAREYPNIQQESLAPSENAVQNELPASLPFAIRRYHDKGPPFARLSRFYHNTAIFYQEGNTSSPLADPFQALPMAPAATANFASRPVVGSNLPAFHPDRCTGCGTCFTYCPHSALPTVAIGLQSLIRSGMKLAGNRGRPVSQLMALERNLSRTALAFIKKNPGAIRKVRDFLMPAFEELAGEGKIQEEKLEKAKEGISVLNEVIGDYPVAVTEPFFLDAKKIEKGGEKLLSINLDPHACTRCGLCVTACPDDALEMMPAGKERLGQLAAALDIWQELPDTPSETIRHQIEAGNISPLAATLLGRNFYYSLTGGATTEAGAAGKAVVHWVTAVAESILQPRLAQRAAEATKLIEELSKNIHQYLSNALPKSDFGLAASILADLPEDKLPLEELIRQLKPDDPSTAIDLEVLRRKMELLEDLRALRWSMVEGPTGQGKARYSLVCCLGGGLEWMDDYPFNPFIAPVLLHWDGDAPERIRGILKGQERHLLDHVRLLRRAALEIKDKYRPGLHEEEIGKLSWRGLSDKEKELLPPLLLVGGPGLLTQDKQGSLMGLLASEFPIKVLILDQAASDPQESYSQAFATFGTIVSHAALMRLAYLFRGSLPENPNLYPYLQTGLLRSGPALFHLLAPDTRRHTEEARYWPRLAELAVKTRAFFTCCFDPEQDEGHLSSGFSLDGNPAPDHEWVSETLQFQEGGEEKQLAYRLTYADWLLTLEDWQACFQSFDKEKEAGVPLADYLVLSSGEQAKKVPLAFTVNGQGQLETYAVGPQAVEASRRALGLWNNTRELAGTMTPFPEKLREEAKGELKEQYGRSLAEMKATYEKELQDSEAKMMKRIRIQLREKLMALSRREIRNE